MKYLITGGSGCGKSTWAEKLMAALPEKDRFYVATMQVCDAESVSRVERHRRQRQTLDTVTIERAKNIGASEISPGSAVLIEDIPNLLANEMFDGGEAERIVADVETLARKAGDIIIVTNEVFSDGIAYADGTAKYIKHLANINKRLAALCDCVVEVVYSIPVCLKGELPCV